MPATDPDGTDATPQPADTSPARSKGKPAADAPVPEPRQDPDAEEAAGAAAPAAEGAEPASPAESDPDPDQGPGQGPDEGPGEGMVRVRMANASHGASSPGEVVTMPEAQGAALVRDGLATRVP